MLSSVIGSAFWNVAATFIQLLLQLLVLALLGRLLVPEDFGLVGIATAVTAFAGLIGQLGIGQALIQRHAIDEQTVRAGFTLSAMAGALAAAITVALSGPLASAFNTPAASPFIRIVALSVIGLSLGTVADALLQREMRFREVGFIAVGSYVTGYVLIAVPLALLGYGAWSLAIAFVVQALTKAALSLWLHPHAVVPLFDVGRSRELLSFGGRVTLSKLLNSLALQGDNLLVARALGPLALGLYSRSYQLMLIPVQLIGQTMSTVLYPALSQAQERKASLRDAYLSAAGIATLLGGIASALFVPLAPEIILFVLGSGWEEAILPFRLLSVVILLRVAYKLDDTLAKATGALNARLARDLIYGLAIVAGVYIGVRFGIGGAAIAVGCAIALNHALGVSMSLKITGASLGDYLVGQRATLLLTPTALAATYLLRSWAENVGAAAFLTIVLVSLGVLVLLVATVLLLPGLLHVRQRRLLVSGLARLPDSPLKRAVVNRIG